MACCGSSPGDRFDVGDQAVIVFRFVPVPQHPTAESTEVTVTLLRPDGSEFGEWTSPSPTLTRSTATEAVNGVDTLVTYWTFEMPSPFDVGSRRNPWRARAASTDGIIAAVTTDHWVAVSAFV